MSEKKNIKELFSYGENSLLEWNHGTHTDFVIATKYNKELQTWEHGTYLSYYLEKDREVTKQAAEHEFFIKTLREVDGGAIDFSKFEYRDLSAAHHEMWTQCRIDYIKDFLQENEPELLEKLDDKEIRMMASDMTNFINDNTYLIEEISEVESEYLCDYVAEIKKEKIFAPQEQKAQVGKDKVKDSIRPDKSKPITSKDKGER